MVSNFFFGLTLLFYVGLISINNSQPNTSGEAGMGYGLALFALGIGFAICSLILTLGIARKSGFDWVLTEGAARNVLIGAFWLSMAATTFACAVFKWEWHEGEFPKFLRWLAANHGNIWIPLLMLIPYFILLNSGMRSAVSPNMYKIPLVIGFALGVISSLGLLVGWFNISEKQRIAQIERSENADKEIHEGNLKTIAAYKISDPQITILSFTGRFHDEDVRSAAIAKIKENPNWENELLELLDNEYYFTAVYTFLDGNKVDHPEKFLEPLNRSIFRLASNIETTIQDANNLQSWTFDSYGIERLLRALNEQFIGLGTDFRPAIVKIHEALATERPERFKKVQFDIQRTVDNWLKTNQK